MSQEKVHEEFSLSAKGERCTLPCRPKTSYILALKLKISTLPITLETLLLWQNIFYSNTKFDALSYETKLSSVAGTVFQIYVFPVFFFYLRLLRSLKSQ